MSFVSFVRFVCKIFKIEQWEMYYCVLGRQQASSYHGKLQNNCEFFYKVVCSFSLLYFVCRLRRLFEVFILIFKNFQKSLNEEEINV